MKSSLFASLLLLQLFSCSGVESGKADENAGSDAVTDKENPDYWYSVFSGRINNKEYALYLSKGENYNGYFFDLENNIPVNVYSNSQDPLKDDSLILNGGNHYMSVQLNAVLRKGTIDGNLTFESPTAASRSFSFQLDEQKGYTPFEFYFVKSHASAPKKLNNESTADYRFGTVWPARDLPWTLPLKQYIVSKIDSQTQMVSNPLALLEKAKNSAIGSWQQNMDTLTAATAGDLGLSLSQENENTISVLHEDSAFLSIANFTYEYTGGAHGMHFTEVVNFNKQTGRQILLTDLLTKQGINALPQLLEKAARRAFEIKSGSLEQNGFFVNQIKPSNSYYFSNGGIGFYYAPYDLKSYAEGEIILFIPSSDLQPYLKKEK